MNDQSKTSWKIDNGHSSVGFRIRHMAIANVSGAFLDFEGQVSCAAPESFEGAAVDFEIRVDSLTTNHSERDTHLRSELFFDTVQYPVIRFKGILRGDQLSGDLTIRDVTRAVVLDANLMGSGQGRFGEMRAGFELNGKINRKDFGLTWSMLTEAGSLIVGEEVKLDMNIELIRS
ncbi:Polyisoprenoid-binding protein YceI [Chitinophaga sp. YR627]|uniref:YceI family protein n=1 Tax=Chitinophaga sp. YR627 TaxID=1881041 RepID=UPI0008EBA72B|nr:YceI family protein [Chitinophaga sp. YR627]SFN18663.1 Polyisoprenoid-binding protein YceI [Chitinophaga sp. YR627]